MQLKSFNLDDFKFLIENLKTTDLSGSDTTIANLFLLQKKYNTKFCIAEGIFFRYYHGNRLGRRGYGFPLPLKKTDSDYLTKALKLIEKDASQNNRPIEFCLFTQEQKSKMTSTLHEVFSDRNINWNTDRADSDYLYLQKKLSELPGSEYHKKKNHISKFYRKFENVFSFKKFPENKNGIDMIQVAEKWLEEKKQSTKILNEHADTETEDLKKLDDEKESIKTAIENAELFGFKGGVLYIDNQPAGMTLASPISSDTLDIIYEKVILSVAKEGGYAAINQLFANTCKDYLYLNREEDLGIEGLRKSKLSYHPDIILDKFYGKVEKC